MIDLIITGAVGGIIASFIYQWFKMLICGHQDEINVLKATAATYGERIDSLNEEHALTEYEDNYFKAVERGKEIRRERMRGGHTHGTCAHPHVYCSVAGLAPAPYPPLGAVQAYQHPSLDPNYKSRVDNSQ